MTTFDDLSPYAGIFIRDDLGQTPGNKGIVWSNSPDIILAGIHPAPDPTVYTTTQGYSTDYGSNVFLNQANYVYIRGENASGGAITSRIWFYHVESNLCLWTQNWSDADIVMNGNKQNYIDMTSGAPNEIDVTPPFLWSPPDPQQGQHYCVIAWVENPPLSEPPQSPLPSGSMGTAEELTQFVLTHPNIGWRNTIDVDNAVPTWQQIIELDGPVDGGTVNVGIQCKGMANGGKFSFQVPGPDKENSIDYPPTDIIIPTQEVSVQVNYPPNFETAMVVNFWQASEASPPGSDIIAQVTIATAQFEEYLRNTGQARSPIVYPSRDILLYNSPKLNKITPTNVLTVGSVPLRFKAPNEIYLKSSG